MADAVPGSSKSAGKVPGSAATPRTWANVVQGGLRRPTWSSPRISDGEVDELTGFFSSILELPVQEVADSRRLWEGRSLIVRSLGRRVSVQAIQREFRWKLQSSTDPEVFPLAVEHFIVRFEGEEACGRALKEGPWVIAGQLFAVENWRPRFNPSRTPVTKALVWLRLPFLPAEYWSSASILKIAERAGRPVEVDSFTDNLTRMGYARVKVELDTIWPLAPGVLVKDEGEPFWQQFQFENISHVCFLCGLVGHLDSECQHQAPGPLPCGSRPRLGPWVIASKLWQPWSPSSSGGSSARPDRSVPSSSPRASPGTSEPTPTSSGRSPLASAAPPAVSREPEGWRKPTKVARRAPPVRSPAGHDDDSGPSPGPLALIPVRMELQPSFPDPVDTAMPSPDACALKRGRSPSPDAEEVGVLSLVVPKQLQRPKRTPRLPAKLRDSPAQVTPPSRGSEVHSRDPCMADASTAVVDSPGELGCGSSGLVRIPVVQAGSWRGAMEGAAKGGPARDRSSGKGKISVGNQEARGGGGVREDVKCLVPSSVGDKEAVGLLGEKCLVSPSVGNKEVAGLQGEKCLVSPLVGDKEAVGHKRAGRHKGSVSLRADPEEAGGGRGSHRMVGQEDSVLGGSGQREGGRKRGGATGKKVQAGGSLEPGSPAWRERSRSPRVDRVVGISVEAPGSGSKGDSSDRPPDAHHSLVARVQQAVLQLGEDERSDVVGDGERGGGGGKPPSVDAPVI